MQFFCRHRNSPTVQIEVENIAQSKTISLIIDLQINTTTRNKGSKQQSTNDASWMLLFVNDTHLWYCIQSVSNDNALASMQQSMILVSMNTTINEWVDVIAKCSCHLKIYCCVWSRHMQQSMHLGCYHLQM